MVILRNVNKFGGEFDFAFMALEEFREDPHFCHKFYFESEEGEGFFKAGFEDF